MQQQNKNPLSDPAPEANEQSIVLEWSYSVTLSLKEYRAILEACIPSEEIRTYLFKTPVDGFTLGDIIWNAPISIYKKAELFESLSHKEKLPQNWRSAIKLRNKADAFHKLSNGIILPSSDVVKMSKTFSVRYEAMQEAISEFENPCDAVFNLVEKWFDEDILDEKGSSGTPFLSSSKAIEYIKEDMRECEIDADSTAWYELEKWVKDENDNLVRRATFTLIGTEPMYFKFKWPKELEEYKWTSVLDCHDGRLNIPLPYTTGDIVWVDCVPFAPPKAALIIESPGSDMSYPTILSRDPKGAWSFTGLKAAFDAINCDCMMPPLSPCYKLRRYEDPLPPDEEILLEVQEWLRSDPERGKVLWEADYELGKYKITVDEIRQVMKVADTVFESNKQISLLNLVN